MKHPITRHPCHLAMLALLALALLPMAATTACSRHRAPQPVATTTATADTLSSVPASPLPPCGTGTAFIVVSKRDLTLRVYDRDSLGDTVLLAQFPVCLGKGRGDKQSRGDMRTPQSPHGKPFTIIQVQDASTWRHDFGDGRGSILAYGHWFLRLRTPGHSGIGIHGSTGNEGSVPGRASEGCIRLRDADIITLKQLYAYVGMPVHIKAEGEGPYPWEPS